MVLSPLDSRPSESETSAFRVYSFFFFTMGDIRNISQSGPYRQYSIRTNIRLEPGPASSSPLPNCQVFNNSVAESLGGKERAGEGSSHWDRGGRGRAQDSVYFPTSREIFQYFNNWHNHYILIANSSICIFFMSLEINSTTPSSRYLINIY